MNMEEAIDALTTMRKLENWPHRHEDHYDPLNLGNQKYVLGPNMPFPNFSSNMNESNYLNTNSNTMNTNNVSSAFVPKMLYQGNAAQGLGGNPSISSSTRNMQSQPSTQQLKMLVGQIQMAVQAGFLSHQVRKNLISI